MKGGGAEILYWENPKYLYLKYACPRRTTMKEGPNKGKDFNACAKSREEQCGFFKWVEEAGTMPPSQVNGVINEKKKHKKFHGI